MNPGSLPVAQTQLPQLARLGWNMKAEEARGGAQ